MAAPLTATQRATATNGSHPAGLRTARRRQPKVPWVALGVIMVLGAALGFARWADSLGDRVPVLAAARDIPAGTQISAADLREVSIASDGDVGLVAAAQADQLLGQVAAASIPEGALLHRDHLTDGSLIGPGEAVVGARLEPGAIPTPDLRVGDRVEIVASAAPNSDEGPTVLATGRVFALRDIGDTTGSVVVSLLVPSRSAAQIADAAGAGRVRLVLLSPAPEVVDGS